ncbi:MAG: EAL domain-containing protein [Paracoccaceae bacterium]|nr:MAG: EAL domain-containing protein [Paracoccaceae bacterium]
MRGDRRRPLADMTRDEASPLAAAIAEQDRQTIAMVRDALDEGRLCLAYQPVVMGAEPDRVAFHEGLIRVLDPTGRVIPAREFIGAVEATEIGRQIDCSALDMGLAALAAHPHLRLAVNMSARSIGYPRWMRVLRRGLSADPTVAERLILEITESSAMLVPEIVTAFMDDLQATGVAFALDDFGSGYTSFRYLRDFFFDILKIDGQFTSGIARDADNQALTRALMSVGRHFDMVTVAEAVETPEDAAWLQAEGIGAMQGYLFGAPTVRPAWAEDQARRRRA